MRVTTKIIAGFGALVLLMVGALAYQAYLVHRMQEINLQITEVNLRTSLTVLNLNQSLVNAEDFATKYLVTGDTDFGEAFQAFQRQFDLGLTEIAGSINSPEQRLALERLRVTWEEFLAAFQAVESDLIARQWPPDAYTDLPVRLQDLLGRISQQVGLLNAVTRQATDAELQRSTTTTRQVEMVSWAASTIALLLAGGIAFQLARSLTGALRRLMGGTRAVAAGHFQGRLPEGRRDELGELARSFNQMASRLQELDQLKKDFVSSVSHELKSPIASSREIAQLMLEEIPGPLNPEQKRLLQLSVRTSRRLSSMIGGLLDLAKMDAGTMHYEKRACDLAAVVRSTLEEFEIALEDRGIRIVSELGGPWMVSCDDDRIVQVIGNLIDNAMKFSRRGSSIVLRLDPAPGAGGVIFSIVDSGPGIPDRHKESIFAKFQQVRTEGSKQHGVGLGLAICKSIIDAHNGRIWVEDNPAGGSVFRFVLPPPTGGKEQSERIHAASI